MAGDTQPASDRPEKGNGRALGQSSSSQTTIRSPQHARSRSGTSLPLRAPLPPPSPNPPFSNKMNSSEKPVVKIGALQYFGFESSEPDLGLVWQWATQIIIDAVNASPTLLPDVTLELILHDTEGDKFVAMGHSIDFVHEHHVAAIFGAMYSGISMPTSQYTGAYNLPQVNTCHTHNTPFVHTVFVVFVHTVFWPRSPPSLEPQIYRTKPHIPPSCGLRRRAVPRSLCCSRCS